MKKIFLAFFVLILVVSFGPIVMAANEGYTISMETNKNIFKNVPIQTDVKLIGSDAVQKASVRIKVDISGPGTPKLIATDSTGTQWDIAQIGYWGPETGFAVGGTFTNSTPVTATFPEAGLYEIKVSLINLADGSTITSSNNSIYVYKDQAELDAVLNGQNNTSNAVVGNDTNNVITGNTVEEIPETGTSFGQYLIYTLILAVMIGTAYSIIKKYRVH